LSDGDFLGCGNRMNMTPVASSNVQSVGYDHPTRTMRVAFRKGGVYDYSGVAPELFESMLLPHPWRRLGRIVRRHHCNRVA
jgi:hypothetical protein